MRIAAGARGSSGIPSAASQRVSFRRDESGASAVEMALLAPAFLMLLIGIIQGGLLVYTKASLHYTVQRSVRCYTLTNAAGCLDPTPYYFAPGPAPVMAKTEPTIPAGPQKCVAVTGTVRYDFNIGFVQRAVPLSSTSCFPNIYAAPAS